MQPPKNSTYRAGMGPQRPQKYHESSCPTSGTRGKLLASRAATQQMRPSSKSAKALRIVLGVFALVVALICFQLATHRHTGILRTLANAKHFLSDPSPSRDVQQRSTSPPPGPQHNVNLSWKASTSAVVGYNVYRRGGWGLVKLNFVPISGTSYVTVRCSRDRPTIT